MRCLLLLLALATPATALACRSVHSHNYVVLTDPPYGLPDGAVLLRVRWVDTGRDVDGKEMDAGLPARVLAGGGLAGRTVYIRTEIWTVCSGPGPTEGYVVGFPDRSRKGHVTINAILYRERQNRSPAEEWSRSYRKPEASR